MSHRASCTSLLSSHPPQACDCDHRTIRARIERDFTYHAPDEATRDVCQKLRAYFLALAEEIVDRVPNGREQANALTRLEEAMMHAVAGVVRPIA